MKIIPYITAGYIVLSFIIAIIIPVAYTKVVRVKRKKRIKCLSRYNRLVITGIFSFILGLLSICCTPVLIPFVQEITNGYEKYPEICTAMVGVVLLGFFGLMFAILTITTSARVRMIRNSLGA